MNFCTFRDAIINSWLATEWGDRVRIELAIDEKAGGLHRKAVPGTEATFDTWKRFFETLEAAGLGHKY